MLHKLTEGIRERSVTRESEQLVSKWEATGLLEGLTDDNRRSGMARLLENQAAQLLKEESSMSAGGDVEGFAAVAFPIVRRVFGGLIAQDIVSVQPMSLPSGLVFFMDFTRTNNKHGDQTTTDHYSAGESVYGGRVVAKNLATGGDFDSTSTIPRDSMASTVAMVALRLRWRSLRKPALSPTRSASKTWHQWHCPMLSTPAPPVLRCLRRLKVILIYSDTVPQTPPTRSALLIFS